LFSRALYGQSEGETDDGHPRQILDWVDEIPAGATVAVGHSWFSDAPRRTLGRLGGAVWHLDTGAGKGGRLGWIDVPTEELGDGAALRREKHVSLGEKAGWRAADGTPLLTILVGPSGAGKTTWAKANAPDGAWISSDAVREELLGDARDQSRGGEIVRVVRIRAAERLSRGLPVVLDMTHLRARERKESLALLSKGAPARYVVIDRPLEEKLRDGGWRLGQAGPYGGGLVEDHDRRFTSGLPQILSGDGVEGVEVLDLRKTKVE